MKTEDQIKAKIAELEADPIYQEGLKNPATLEINAPKALIQLDLEVRIKWLKWVLRD